ncbi:Panacea domain-containing protein [Nitrolancea hollandica]|uniref:Antitoxin SocA-like Panacea domain-containing protein n=1 Tax=Nitrolancea hollandica Lb TaxID=1129897 RepID=I4EFF2_9BACT|nr:type II toxin-antitoxin system antitoxin SocA domain-containing protein [Nitrolancea hollandica]CCF83414.1 conserved hypothetical protein [Nitrolancea hollandica Lb]
MATVIADKRPIATAADVARYFIALATEHGDLITNLKMQKLVYYAYAWTLVRNEKRLFSEAIEAWPNGPVVNTLYHDLKGYGAKPIDVEEFLGIEPGKIFDELPTKYDELVSRFPEDVLETLDGVYEEYAPLSAFELVTMTHHEKPWVQARRGLEPTEHSVRRVDDDDIVAQFDTAEDA